MSLNWIPDICLYHNVVLNFPCPDGLASAWVVRLKFLPDNENLEFIGVTYEEVKNLEYFLDGRFINKNILVVDFSLKPEVLELLKNQGCSVRIIDHHKSYLKEVTTSKVYNLLTAGKSFSDTVRYYKKDKSYYFDSSESGASLTWKLLFPNEPLPEWLEIIRQNDLFDFKDELAEAIHYGIAKLNRNFKVFDTLHEDCLNGNWFFTRLHLAEIGQESIDSNLVKFEKIINNPNKFSLHSGIPIIILPNSELYLKSRIAKYTNEKFNSLFTIIVTKDFSRVRVKGKIDLLTLFASYKAVGHEPACSFDWSAEKGLEGVKELIDLSLKRLEKELEMERREKILKAS